MNETMDNLATAIEEKYGKTVTISATHHLGPESGLHLALPNGFVVSVQTGPGTYCENHDMLFALPGMGRPAPEGGYLKRTKTAEIAYFNGDSGLLSFEDGDSVKGHQTIEDILRFVDDLLNDRLPVVTPAWYDDASDSGGA